MATSSDAMEYVKTTLGGTEDGIDLIDQLCCVSRMRVLALALGAEGTREKLIPYLQHLHGLDDHLRLGDEVLTGIAEMLGGMQEFVGGPSEAHCLIPPLILLCSIDETTVRGQAVDSIALLCQQLSPSQIRDHLASKVLELCDDTWFPKRVSACGLVASAYKGCTACKAENLAKDLLKVFKSMCEDPEPMVRHTAARCLGDVMKETPSPVPEYLAEEHDSLVACYVRFLDGTDSETIRVNALKSSTEVFRHVAICLEAAQTLAGKAYVACCDDQSWRVRVALAESLVHVASMCSRMRSQPAGVSEVTQVEDVFSQLLEDSETEVKNATAKQAAAAAAVFGAEFAMEKLVAKLIFMAEDGGLAQNGAELCVWSRVLLEMAQPLGPENAKKVFLECPDTELGTGMGMVKRLLSIDLTDHRIAVINMLPGLIDVITIAHADQILDALYDLCEDKNWRVRHAALTRLPELALQMPEAIFEKFIGLKESPTPKGSNVLKGHMDNCDLIRLDFVRVFAKIGKTYGADWLVQWILPSIEENLDPKGSYQLRSVVLHAFTEFGALLPEQKLKDVFLPAALEMSESPVANLRIAAAETLGTVYRNGWLASAQSELKKKLEELSSGDSDVDVKEAAAASLAAA